MCNYHFIFKEPNSTNTVAGSSNPLPMSESYLAIMQREMMQSYIWLKTADGSIHRVEKEIAIFFPMICQEVVCKGVGTSKNHPISLPQQVNQATLSLILNYCRFHLVHGRSNKERKTYDQKFIRMDTTMLRELASAADSLQLKPLVDLTCRTLGRSMEGKTPEEMREILNFPDDLSHLTDEERLLPLKNTMDDPGIRLLNRLNAKKRKELKEGERLQNVEVEEHVDERSVDDLVSFINGGDAKVVKTSKGKKKNKKKKDQKIVSSNEKEGAEETGSITREVEVPNLPSTEDDIFTPKAGSEDGDSDDEMDPAMKEMLDREVEDFARRLNSSWVGSQGQVRRPVHFSMNGNGTTRRHIGMISLLWQHIIFTSIVILS
ncbi:unnamed protein product [Brassica oleracea var. botrytis]